MRLRVELAKKLNVPVAKVNSMVLDEDGVLKTLTNQSLMAKHCVITQKLMTMF